MEELMPFKTGVVDDPGDPRDYKYEELVGAGEPFDWEKGYDVEEEMGASLKRESQNGSLSCVGQGIAKYAEVLNFFDEGILRDFSAKDIYSNIRLPQGCALISEGVKWLVNHGVEEESNIPSYDRGKPPTEAYMADKVARNEDRALRFRAKSYLTTTHNDIDYLAMMIRDNHGLVTSYEGDNYNWSAKFMTPPKKPTFSHCVYIKGAKMINGKKYILVLNSGGTKVGENGVQYMPEEYFGYLKNIWVIRDLITKEENMIVDEAKLEQIYQELLIGSAADDPGAKNHLGKPEDEVRKAVGQSDERQRIIACVNAARNVLKR